MVAAEPLREAGVTGSGSRPGFAAGGVDIMGMSVREIRELVGPRSRPDPALLVELTRDPRVTVRRLAFGALRRGGDLAANENVFRIGGIRLLAGADEAGRGALAGPLVAAAVMFDEDVVVEGVDDSKVLLPEVREELYGEIIARARSVSVVFVGPGLIDRWGLQQANLKALGDAVAGVDERCQCVICDHFTLGGCATPTHGVPKADATFQSVAAASIVAKVERDRVMASLHRFFPRYKFKTNKGYGTEEHRSVLAVHGPCRIHRMSFEGVGNVGEDRMLWGP